MRQTQTFTPPAERSTQDSAPAMDDVDVFETAMTILQNAGVGFLVLDETEPMEQAA